MKIKVVFHIAEEGGYWAEVPALPGCFSQGSTIEETKQHIREAIEAILEIEEGKIELGIEDEIHELAL